MKLLSEIAEVVAVVQAVEGAKKRKDIPLRPGVTFFSIWDEWIFNARSDGIVCQQCANLDGQTFRGHHLRARFPYLKIQDENTITGLDSDDRGLVHPHCRCVLVRQIG